MGVSHKISIPMEGILTDQDGGYKIKVGNNLYDAAYFLDVECWFLLQESEAGKIINCPVWMNDINVWQEGSSETFHLKPPQKLSNLREINLPRVPMPTSPLYRVPTVVHFIWLGNNEIPKELVARMKKSTICCPSYKFVLHAHAQSKRGWEKLTQQFPSDGRIILHNLSCDIEFKTFIKSSLGFYYQQFLKSSSRNYAAASDILRLVLLRKYGGIYMDVDDEIMLPVPIDKSLMADINTLLLNKMISIDVFSFEGYGNSNFACIPGNTIITEMLNEMLNRLNKNQSLFCISRPWYDQDTFLNHEKKMEMHDYLIKIFHTTGPFLFSDILKKHQPAAFNFERNFLSALRILMVSPQHPRIIAEDYLDEWYRAKAYYQPFTGHEFFVRLGAAQCWNPAKGSKTDPIQGEKL